MQSNAKDTLYECTIGPGEVLFFPDHWWHATINIGETVGLSEKEGDCVNVKKRESEGEREGGREGGRGGGGKRERARARGQKQK